MKIGYACICLGQAECRLRTCTMKYASEEKLASIIHDNLKAMQHILSYNAQHHIQMFRLSSDLIPFGSSEVNTLDWRTMYREEFEALGRFVKQQDMRISMHPGQYTLLNAMDENIVKRSILDLEYHCAVLDLMRLDATHKLILHVGGIYQDKQAAIQRFIKVYQTLSKNIQKRLIIENDDRYYTIEDVLEIAKQVHIPVVFDNLHHTLNPPQTKRSLQDWIQIASSTWNESDGVCKLHYSEQDPTKRRGAHAQRICASAFLTFVHELRVDVDVMLEVKDKNFSAVKACALLGRNPFFYEEWSYYRYIVYMQSKAYYVLYASLFEQKQDFDRLAFYEYVDTALEQPYDKEACRMLFRLLIQEYETYFDERTLKHIERYQKDFQNGDTTCHKCIGMFYRIAVRQSISSLQNALFLLQMEV